MNNNDFRHRWWLYLLLTITLLLVVLPFAWMVLGSIKPENELVRTQPTWWPHHPTLDNFHRLFSGQPWGKYLANSIVVSAAVTAGSLLFSSMLGYALARLNYPGKKLIFGAVMGCLMIPGLVMFIPQYVLIVNMGLANTLTALILPFLVQPFGAFLMRQFFLGIPRDLLEAGRIDGAGELTIFFRIFLPLATPAFATLGILTFLGSWNSFLWPLVVSSSQDTYTLPVALALASTGEDQTDYGLLMAGATLVVLPILLVFLFCQRFILEGLSHAGLK